MSYIYLNSLIFYIFFFFSSRRRHTRLQGDWSSDVCSSDLEREFVHEHAESGRCGSGLHAEILRRQRFERRQAERSEEHTSELQSPCNLVCRLLLEKKKIIIPSTT